MLCLVSWGAGRGGHGVMVDLFVVMMLVLVVMPQTSGLKRKSKKLKIKLHTTRILLPALQPPPHIPVQSSAHPVLWRVYLKLQRVAHAAYVTHGGVHPCEVWASHGPRVAP